MGLSENKPVSDVRCERLVIGTILTKDGSFNEVAEFLDEKCFTDFRSKEIYIAAQSLREKGEKCDIITICAELNKLGSRVTASDVAEALDTFTIDSLVPYALRLQELAKRRRMWEIGVALINAGTQEVTDIDEARQQTMEAINKLFDSLQGVFTLGDAFSNLLEIIAKNMSSETGMTGTFTGLRQLDGKGGLQGSDLIIVAGETSMGKSSLALSIAKNAISRDHKIAMYSMEMTKEQLAARIASAESDIPSNDILYSSSFTTYDWQKINSAISRVKAENLFFDDRSTSNIETILASIRSMKMKYGIDGAIIDYLQILNVNMKGYSREQIMGDVARRLKNLAKELNIWIMALSQLNRNSADPVPTLNRLRDSGQIAEASDIVMLIWRPSYYGINAYTDQGFEGVPVNGTAMIHVAKGRNIGTFKFVVGFDSRTTSFKDIDLEQMNNQEPISEPDIMPAPF